MTTITQAELKWWLSYDPETGEFVWIKSANKNCVVGSIAGKVNKYGYRIIRFYGKGYPAHRLVWLYVHGGWPQGLVDHINHDRADNRLLNLRDVPPATNSRNLSKSKNNKSGVTGVLWCRRREKWSASIIGSEKTLHLGYFDTIESAAATRKAAQAMLGYHPNHGI